MKTVTDPSVKEFIRLVESIGLPASEKEKIVNAITIRAALRKKEHKREVIAAAALLAVGLGIPLFLKNGKTSGSLKF